MKILITGSHGLIGKHLFNFLEFAGHDVWHLSRSNKDNETQTIVWNPITGQANIEQFEGFNVIVNLAGENIAKGRWTKSKKERVLKLEQTRNKLKQAKLKIVSDSISLEAEEVNLSIAKRQYNRIEELYEEGLKSRLDFETKQLNRNDTKNLNRLFDLLSDRVTLYRYAGCVHNHEPAYLNETCEQFTNVAPKVKVQGAGTYWDNTVSGFNAILLDMVSDIGVLNVDKLSVAVCPSCAPYDQITQEELYERMDLICRLNITSISAFTIDEILERYGVNNTGGRWMEAFRYFRTGEKK